MELNLKKKNGNGGNGSGRKHGNGNGNGNGHKNGNGYSSPGSLLRLALLALAVVLVAVLVWRQVDRWQGPKQNVWIAADDIAAGVTLVGEALEQVAMRIRNIPEGAITDPGQIVGRRLARPLAAGQTLTRADVAVPRSPQQQAASLAELLPEGRVLAPVRVDLDSVIVPELRFGDRLEIISSGGSSARVVASDAFFLAWIDPALLARNGNGGSRSQPQGGLLSSLMSMPTGVGGGGSSVTSSTKLLLALHPRDVLPTTAASNGRLTAILHARREVAEGRMITLPTTSPNEVELIAGSSRQNVRLRQATERTPAAAINQRSTQAAVGGGGG